MIRFFIRIGALLCALYVAAWFGISALIKSKISEFMSATGSSGDVRVFGFPTGFKISIKHCNIKTSALSVSNDDLLELTVSPLAKTIGVSGAGRFRLIGEFGDFSMRAERFSGSVSIDRSELIGSGLTLSAIEKIAFKLRNASLSSASVGRSSPQVLVNYLRAFPLNQWGAINSDVALEVSGSGVRIKRLSWLDLLHNLHASGEVDHARGSVNMKAQFVPSAQYCSSFNRYFSSSESVGPTQIFSSLLFGTSQAPHRAYDFGALLRKLQKLDLTVRASKSGDHFAIKKFELKATPLWLSIAAKGELKNDDVERVSAEIVVSDYNYVMNEALDYAAAEKLSRGLFGFFGMHLKSETRQQVKDFVRGFADTVSDPTKFRVVYQRDLQYPAIGSHSSDQVRMKVQEFGVKTAHEAVKSRVADIKNITNSLKTDPAKALVDLFGGLKNG